jgi:membrane associated rhomboid family serine protease
MESGTGKKRSSHRWVMLQRPGWNVATVVPLSMILVHFALLLASGPTPGISPEFYQWGGLYWEGLARGRFWQLLTHLWLHGNLAHLSVNVLLFYYAAARLSHFLSGKRIMALFLICGVGSGIAHILTQLVFPELPGVVGASGCLTGLLLGYFSISPESRMILLNVSAANLAKGILIASGLLFLVSPVLGLPGAAEVGKVFEMLLGQGVFQAAHLVHFVGGLTGWVFISKFLPPLLTREDLTRMRVQQEVRATSR